MENGYDARVSLTEQRLAEELIRAESLSGREGKAAEVLLDAYRELAFDEAYLDAAGNAIGVFRRGGGPLVMLNGHLDTVPLGDESLWPHPPLGGVVADGLLWGRGACDMKAAVACMALAARDAAEQGFGGTLMVAGVVQEEVGGLGSRYLATTCSPQVVILGEPSNLALALGHRGRVVVEVELPGKIAHAARAWLGENALERAAALVSRLRELELPSGGPLGGASATATTLVTFPHGGVNVVPGRAQLTIDYRSLPGESVEAVLARIQALDPGATVRVPVEEASSASGEVRYRQPLLREPYLAPAGSSEVATARRVLAAVSERHHYLFQERSWWFGTDAPLLAETGAVVIGFGPGDDELAHTTNEHVPVEHLKVARDGYRELALAYLDER